MNLFLVTLGLLVTLVGWAELIRFWFKEKPNAEPFVVSCIGFMASWLLFGYLELKEQEHGELEAYFALIFIDGFLRVIGSSAAIVTLLCILWHTFKKAEDMREKGSRENHRAGSP